MGNEWVSDGIRQEDIIPIDFAKPDLPNSVKILKPILYKDGDSFCLLAGADPESGTFGCGKTIEEALADFDVTFKKGDDAKNAG